jgi:hypothetical protein
MDHILSVGASPILKNLTQLWDQDLQITLPSAMSAQGYSAYEGANRRCAMNFFSVRQQPRIQAGHVRWHPVGQVAAQLDQAGLGVAGELAFGTGKVVGVQQC